MQTHQQLTHFAGFDWAKNHHGIIVIDAKGQIVADFRIDHTASGWKLWGEKIAAYPKLGVAIETSFGSAFEQLMESGVAVYPVNPMNAKRYRERKWEKFLHSHRLYRSQTYQARIAAFEKAGEWKVSAPLVGAKSLYAVARCKQLRVLQGQLDEMWQT